MFGLRNRERPRVVEREQVASAYIVHYVEHDKTMMVDGYNIDDVVQVAKGHMHVFNDGHNVCARPMYYADNTLCVIIYGEDYKYTCNIARVTVHDSRNMPDNPFLY